MNYTQSEKATIAAGLLSIRELDNQQLAAFNLAVHAGWSCRKYDGYKYKKYDGYEIVSHLFDRYGYLVDSLLKDAFIHEVNRRVDEGSW